MSEQEKRRRRCCFAGHRPERIHISETDARAWLKAQIETAVDDGYVTFITGMGMGVDIWAAQTVLELRGRNPALHLIAAEPYPAFCAKWSDEWVRAYRQVIRAADYVLQLAPRYTPEAYSDRGKWLVDHAARLIAIYDGTEGYTGNQVAYARAQGLQTVLYPYPRISRTGARPYPLNLIDALMDCETYLTARQIEAADLAPDFDERLSAALATLSDPRAADLMLERYRDGATLQAIGDRLGISRERARQLTQKYLKRLRQPDVLRFLDCGIEGIPEKTTAAAVKRLEEAWAKTAP